MSRYRSAARFFLLLVVTLVATACSSASFEVAFQDVSVDVDVPSDTQDLDRNSASDALDALVSEPGTDAGRDAAEAETSVVVDSSPEADAEPVPEATPEASADTTGEAKADTDAPTDAKKDAVPDALEDACPGGGSIGEVVIGVCKPPPGDAFYLGVALRVLYPPGTIVPNEEWKDPWPGCSSSTTADCICCHVRPSSGAAMPLKTDIDFRAGTSKKSGLPMWSWYTAESFAVGSYYGYWGPTQVGYAPHGTFPPLYKGKPNALSRPKSGFNPDNVLFHYE